MTCDSLHKALRGLKINKFWENEEASKAFFENFGFSVEQHSSIEVIDELVSPQKWNLNPEKVEKIARYMTVFSMETKLPRS
jgi:RAB protein geranylgeranyltransferase component A